MKHGFSLVELSIVLVILGLLVGGVLAGKSLIRASELRAVSTEYQRYLTATQAFRDKYFMLPGDITNATSFWGAADGSTGNTVACKTTASTGTETCNGTGNGLIDGSSSTVEYFRFWQHLANAGLIEGAYDGIAHGTADNSATAANSPASKLSSGYWSVAYWGLSSGNGGRFALDYGNSLNLGKISPNTWPADVVMKPEEAWNIDTKLDDGMPAQGKMVIYYWPGCTNAASETDINTTYKLTSTGNQCILIFRRQF